MKYFCILFLFLPLISYTQKKNIDHTAYPSWKTLSSISISNDGKYSVYQIKPLKGDGYVYIVNNLTGKKDSIFRATQALISGNSSFVAFKITPGYDTLRKCELNKIKKEKWPKDSLGIYLFSKDTLLKFPKVKAFTLAENSDWIAIHKEENKLEKTSSDKKKKRKKKKSEVEDVKSDGTVLTYFHPIYNDWMSQKNITEVYFSKYNNISTVIQHQKEKTDSFAIQISDLDKKENWHLPQKYTQISKFTFSNKGTEFAFLASLDTVQKDKKFRLYHYSISNKTLLQLVDTVLENTPIEKTLNEKSKLFFSEDGKRLFFYVKANTKPTSKDTLLDSEKAVLDLWSWTDDRLQPQQLKEIKKDEAKGDYYYFDLVEAKLKFIANDSLNVEVNQKGNGKFAFAFSKEEYEKSYQWDYPGKEDIYRINLQSGENKLLKKGAVHHTELSPSGSFLTFYQEKDKQLYLLDIEQNKEVCVTCLEKDEWLEDVNGMAVLPSLISVPNWLRPTSGEKEEKFIICSENNIYTYDIQLNKLEIITNNEKKQSEWKYSNILKFNADSIYFHPANSYVKALLKSNKSEALILFTQENGTLRTIEKFVFPENIVSIKKAKNADYFVFQKQSVLNYPDLFGTTCFKNTEIKRLSITNPQQKDYNWATAELISWKTKDGTPLEGLIYKPENFDPAKKYPLMVYYYELHGDDLHSHYAPKPTASIIHPTEYASSGFIVFVPDIRYKIGYPARGAYNCIMSGTDYVLRLIPQIDSTKMGLQGQSWGGYQTAQLITMTSRFKAAMAGAPVANMFSAYGGIRWGSGLNRQFQYEKSQSRIGKTIWEAPELYVENSPIFHLPKVETPLLIMHNDMDGAVPWYQSIELFTDLKRLNKKVWLLNYNNDDHNLTKLANKIDLSIRMKQFFSYYLLDQAAPIWMIEGIPAMDKGKKYALEISK